MLFHIPTIIYIIIGGIHSFYIYKKQNHANTLKLVSFHVAWTALIEWISTMGYINLGWIVFITPFIVVTCVLIYISRIISENINSSSFLEEVREATKDINA
jgi:hypothetical protein